MMLQRIVVLCGLAISVMAGDRPDPAAEKERKLLAGLWEFAEPKGGAGGSKFIAVRADGTYSVLDADRKELWDGTYTLDLTINPKVFDHNSTARKKRGDPEMRGIYKLDGGTWELCIREGKEKDRPKEFKAADGAAVVTLKRVKDK
jgi:uncharacterized protein (TIGR03067 family)